MLVDCNNLLSNFQSGFRIGHSTTSAMIKVVHDLSVAFDSGKFSKNCSLDLKKAFDLVDYKKLLEKLSSRFKFSSYACDLLKSYLSNRFQ